MKNAIKALPILVALVFVGFIAYELYRLSYAAFVGYLIVKDSMKTSRERSAKYKDFEDHNDSRIAFYISEFKRANEERYATSDPVMKFKADVKRKMALNCIGYFLQHYEEKWLERVETVDRLYADRLKVREKFSHSKEEELFRHYYFNALEYAIDHFVSPFEENQTLCEKRTPTERIFAQFIPDYIGMKESSLRDDRAHLKKAPYFGSLNKSFYRKSIRETKALIRILKSRFPESSKGKRSQTPAP